MLWNRSSASGPHPRFERPGERFGRRLRQDRVGLLNGGPDAVGLLSQNVDRPLLLVGLDGKTVADVPVVMGAIKRLLEPPVGPQLRGRRPFRDR